MILRCPSVPGDCDRCGQPTNSGVLCELCHTGGMPARPHPKRCGSCGGWRCTVNCPTQNVTQLHPVKTSFRAVA